jgi:hypothetical protein
MLRRQAAGSVPFLHGTQVIAMYRKGFLSLPAPVLGFRSSKEHILRFNPALLRIKSCQRQLIGRYHLDSDISRSQIGTEALQCRLASALWGRSVYSDTASQVLPGASSYLSDTSHNT